MEKFKNLPLIILAAGKSSRMGSPKGLLPFRDKTWLDYQLTQAKVAGLKPLVVLGFQKENYLEVFPRLPHVVNPQPERGMFSSLQVGLRHCDSSKGVYVLLVDCPCPAKEVFERLWHPSADVVKPVYEGRGGHPIFISQKFAQHLMALDPDSSRLDHEIQNQKNILNIEIQNPLIYQNMNTRDEFVRTVREIQSLTDLS